MNTPCGLTQEKLEARDWKWVGENGECIAPFKNANGEIQIGCGELYASHPSSAQGNELFFLFHSFPSRLLLNCSYISHLIHHLLKVKNISSFSLFLHRA